MKYNVEGKRKKKMAQTLTFNELRKIKDQLPSGSMKKIAAKLDLNEDTVRNYFGGWNFEKGRAQEYILKKALTEV